METGGWNIHIGSQNVIEYSADGEHWEIINDPVPGEEQGARHGHCQLAIDNETLFIGGGYNSHLGQDLDTGKSKLSFLLRQNHYLLLSFKAYFYNRETGWKQLQNMPRHRSHMICGLSTNDNGNSKIVVAGGTSL